ncbi:hypothetical protein H5410_001434 [Solanum commersonii]|uniref:Uncharacterized protein n=1 Tax=Solanum commersonii TaxID=4109 RepID=A0A9J6AYQ8_SOLCO|nr:hypothetical protein H5410_001434 [Solanum commersonii]
MQIALYPEFKIKKDREGVPKVAFWTWASVPRITSEDPASPETTTKCVHTREACTTASIMTASVSVSPHLQLSQSPQASLHQSLPLTQAPLFAPFYPHVRNTKALYGRVDEFIKIYVSFF